MGEGAKNILSELGIKIYGGVSGNADEAVKKLLDGKLVQNDAASCDHHHGEHECGNHGEHECHH